MPHNQLAIFLVRRAFDWLVWQLNVFAQLDRD
jgi:hypothetical protein